MGMEFNVLQFCHIYMRVQADMPIRYSQMRALNILCTTPGPHTPMMLADLMHVSRPMIASHLNTLQDAGFVVRVASPDDGRSVYIIPTKQGRSLVEQTNRDLEKFNQKLSENMGTEKFNQFLMMIDEANNILSGQ